MASRGEWATRRMRGTVGELHAVTPDEGLQREVWLMSPTDTALVLGSAQSASVLRQQDGVPVPVVRRRSGGGAVMVAPDDSVWIDVVIGRGDPLWDDDVNRAPLWLGRVWATALSSLGAPPGEVCQSFEPGRWGRLACFAGTGPGEVLIRGAKAVGVTQRRTRSTARFQTLVYRRWSPRELIGRLEAPLGEAQGLFADLAGAAWTLLAEPEEIRSAFLASLPR